MLYLVCILKHKELSLRSGTPVKAIHHCQAEKYYGLMLSGSIDGTHKMEDASKRRAKSKCSPSGALGVALELDADDGQVRQQDEQQDFAMHDTV